jgi:hypothetical protein
MTACPHRDQLVALLDGELTENRARALRAHVEDCTACRDELASWQRLIARVAVPAPSPAGASQRVMARLDDATSPIATRRRWPAFGGLALAASAAVALAIALHWPRAHGPELVARGGGVHSLARDVNVSVYASEATLRPLHDGAAISANTAFAVSYRNLGAPAYAVVVAVDAAGDLHWIAPAYLSTATDPSSCPLGLNADDTVLPNATVLDSPAPGPLRVFVLVTPSPIHVSELEQLARPIDASALLARWPDADVRVLALDLATDRSFR